MQTRKSQIVSRLRGLSQMHWAACKIFEDILPQISRVDMAISMGHGDHRLSKHLTERPLSLSVAS